MKKEINLKSKTEKEIFDFIKDRLSLNPNIYMQLRYVDTDVFINGHRRFDMSGYDGGGNTGECTIFNTAIVNVFADLGIYDYTNYLFLDFYKGVGTLYFQYFQKDENIEIDFGGLGTIEIIYEIFKATILSNKRTRRKL